jgi:hypothetical protein
LWCAFLNLASLIFSPLLLQINHAKWHFLQKAVELKEEFLWFLNLRFHQYQSKPEFHFNFIAPEELQETIQHDWTEYESWVNRLGGQFQTFAKLKSDFSGISNTIKGITDAGAQAWTDENFSHLTDYLKNINDGK